MVALDWVVIGGFDCGCNAGQWTGEHAGCKRATSRYRGKDGRQTVCGAGPGAGAPLYTLTFDNPNGTDVVLDKITDTLPADFVFVGMHPTSDWLEGPVDDVEPEIVWQGPVVIPASGSLSLVYSVFVPETVPVSSTEYENTVEAVQADGASVGPDSVGLLVGMAEVQVAKTADPERVQPGDNVVYTVVLANSGIVPATVDEINDTFDPSLTFVGMVVGSDIGGPDDPNANPLVWTGPFEVPAEGSLTLKYELQTSAVSGWSWPENQVEVLTDGETMTAAETILVGPSTVYLYLPSAARDFKPAYFEVVKTASTDVVATGNSVDYTVTIQNVGDTVGTLLNIYDDLPPGFSFVQMIVGTSDIDDLPAGTDLLTWSGTWDLQPGETITLVYRIQASATAGVYVNAATVTASNAAVPMEPAIATVHVEAPITGLAASNDSPTMEGQATNLWATIATGSNVSFEWDFGDLTPQGGGSPTNHVYPAEGVYTATVTASNAIGQQQATTQVTIEEGVLLEDHFENGIGLWTPFLNYWRLYEGQWYWGENDGVGGSGAATNHRNPINHDKKEAEDALLMYLGEGAEGWTDYRIEAKINIRTENHPHGLWVRGQYEDVGDSDPAGWVTGYYIMVGGGVDRDSHYVSLKQLQTLTDCWDNACNNPQNLYDFNNPHELTFTRKDGNLTRWAWHTVIVEVRGANIKVWLNGVQYIDYTDEKEPFLTGTVGLKVYKAETVSFDDVIVTPLQPLD